MAMRVNTGLIYGMAYSLAKKGIFSYEIIVTFVLLPIFQKKIC